MVGIDFGIEHNMTLSNGEIIDICVQESKGVKLVSKRLNQAYKRNDKKKTSNHNRRSTKLRRVYVVSRSYPSTQICPVCGNKTKQPLQKLDYECSYCGWHHVSRDESNVSLEQIAKSLVEADTAAQVKLCKYSPLKQEAQILG